MKIPLPHSLPTCLTRISKTPTQNEFPSHSSGNCTFRTYSYTAMFTKPRICGCCIRQDSAHAGSPSPGIRLPYPSSSVPPKLILFWPTVYLQIYRCVCNNRAVISKELPRHLHANLTTMSRVQVNLPAESGEMGVLANHVPTIEQLKPGLVEIIKESGGSKTFFRM